MNGPVSLDPAQVQQLLNALGALRAKPPPPSLDPIQLQQLFKAVEALKPDAGWHWHDTLPIFLSSFGGLLVGILVDIFRRWREGKKAIKERREKEIQQTRGALESIGHNLTTLIHISAQNILPHYRETEAAYADFLTTTGDHAATELFSQSLYRYPGLMMTAPPVYFIEYDFLDKLPFLTEKKPNLVMDSAHQIECGRRLLYCITERHKLLDSAKGIVDPGGGITGYQLRSTLQSLASLSVAECVSAIELYDALQLTGTSILEIIASYKIKGDNTKLVTQPALTEILEKLRAVRAKATASMPAP